jgi:hypothetical protein
LVRKTAQPICTERIEESRLVHRRSATDLHADEVGRMKNINSYITDQYTPETQQRKYEYWYRLSKASADYRMLDGDGEISFEQWMLSNWGLKISQNADGYTPYHEIIDENKYLLFLLKYD